MIDAARVRIKATSGAAEEQLALAELLFNGSKEQQQEALQILSDLAEHQQNTTALSELAKQYERGWHVVKD